MIISDKNEIMRILSLPECSDFFDGKDPRYMDGVLYIYNDGCLFPSLKVSKHLNVHAAIPNDIRGARAVKAAKEAILWARSNVCDNIIAQIRKNRRKVRHYAILSGMQFLNEDERFCYYGVL